MKKRYVGGRNVMVAGIMLSQKRANKTTCASKRSGSFEIIDSIKGYLLGISEKRRHGFESLVEECHSDASAGAQHAPFGVDPVFLPTTSMYRDEFLLSDHYPRRSVIPDVKPGNGPFTAAPIELINNRTNVPYGFLPIQRFLPPQYVDKDKDFSIFFDVNFDSAQANNILDYIDQGFFFDRQTQAVILDGLYYNPDLLTFTYLKITVTIDPSGFYSLQRKIAPFSVDNYRTTTDLFRAFLEVIVNIMLVLDVIYELRQVYTDGRRYWWRWSNLFDWCHFIVQGSCWLFWVHLQLLYQRFDPRPRYYVYHDLEAEANFLALNASSDSGLLTEADGINVDDSSNTPTQYTNLAALNHMLLSAATISGELTSYRFLQMLSITMFLARLLQAMHFQPRLGLVTRTIVAAGTDILHWLLLFIIVWIYFVIAGHLSFGNTINEFSTIELSMLAVFKMTLGELALLEQFTLFIPTDEMLMAQLVRA